MKRNKSGPTEKKKTSGKGRLRENIEAVIIAIILALFIRTFVVQAFKIPSGSMQPTLKIGDHILVNKFVYGVKLPFSDVTLIPVSDPDRNDIIVFEYPVEPDKDFIKRVIGVPGDTVEIRDKKVYVNGKPLNHNHGMHTDKQTLPAAINHRDNFGPVTVPEGAYFVLGDNRDNSYDSRFWGFVEEEIIKGKAFIIYWSWNSEEFGARWDRIGMLLH
ncbi:MAG: signal peptidase I [Thermodesulfobacteriota bacterium]